MFNFLASIKRIVSGKVDNIWCVNCSAHRTVLQKGIVEGQDRTRTFKRMVGECTVCSSPTSTFV